MPFARLPIVQKLVGPLSAANTAAASSLGIDLQGYEGPVLIDVRTGTITGTLDGKIQDSADGSTFADVAGLTHSTIGLASQVRQILINPTAVRRYIKYVGTVVTGPVVIKVDLIGFMKYQ